MSKEEEKEEPVYSRCGIDLSDITGSDVKLEKFVNSKLMGNDLIDVPFIGKTTVSQLEKHEIRTLNQLVGVFMSLNLVYADCVKRMRTICTFNKIHQAVAIILYKLDMLGFDVPVLPEGSQLK